MAITPSFRERAALTSFIGRDLELAELDNLVRRSRLVTITGAGGAGKTRLAREFAAAVRPAFAEGAAFVQLASIVEGDLVVVATAAALDVRESPGRSLHDSLLRWLRGREALVVFDNCEHLRATVGALASELLDACPRLRVLTTSRIPLGIAGEVAWRIPSLSLSASMQLFEERAAAVQPGFHIEAAAAVAIQRICERLDGLPLAIELAATRARVLSPQQIAAHLDERFELLSSSSPLTPPRHRTLWATVDWSHQSLNEDARTMWRRLSVFPGSFSFDACARISNLPSVLDALSDLIDHSLVRADSTGAEHRFLMPESVRAYGLEQLEEAEGVDASRRRHADFYLDLSLRAHAHWRGPQQKEWLDRCDLEIDNIRAALQFVIAQGDGETAVRLASGVWLFWCLRGHQTDGQRWLQLGLALAPNPSIIRSRGLCDLALLAYLLGDTKTAIPLLEEGAATADALDDHAGTAFACIRLAVAHHYDGDDEKARALLESALAAERSRTDPFGVYFALYEMAEVLRSLGELDRSEALHDESLALKRAQGDAWHIAQSQLGLARVARARGRSQLAFARAREALASFRALGDRSGGGEALELLAWVGLDLDRPRLAAELLGAADAGRRVEGGHVRPNDATPHDECERRARRALGDAGFARAHAKGTGAGLDIDVDAVQRSANLPQPLTPQELRVTELVAHGSSNREVADKLLISERTVEAHLEHIRNKLDFHSRRQIADWFQAVAVETDS
jgi:predicted ATPase/DNA-binding CsgD family transcriptional regulator